MVSLNVTAISHNEHVRSRRPRGDYRQLVDLDSGIEVLGLKADFIKAWDAAASPPSCCQFAVWITKAFLICRAGGWKEKSVQQRYLPPTSAEQMKLVFVNPEACFVGKVGRQS